MRDSQNFQEDDDNKLENLLTVQTLWRRRSRSHHQMEWARCEMPGPGPVAHLDDAMRMRKKMDWYLWLRSGANMSTLKSCARYKSRDELEQWPRRPLLHVPPSKKATPSLPKI
jgi:hypothetical protein